MNDAWLGIPLHGILGMTFWRGIIYVGCKSKAESHRKVSYS